MPSFSKDHRLALHKRMQVALVLQTSCFNISFFLLQEQDFLPPATRIRNEIEEGEGFSGDDDDDEDDEEERKRSGRGAEVAPPCDMGYYGASQVLLGLFFSFCWRLLLLHEYIPRVEDEAEVDSAAMRTWLMPSPLA